MTNKQMTNGNWKLEIRSLMLAEIKKLEIV